MAVRNVTPMLAVADIDATRAFLRDCLGFDVSFTMEGYAFCHRDRGAIRLIEAPRDEDCHREAQQQIVYIDVDDVDAFYAEHKTAFPNVTSARLSIRNMGSANCMPFTGRSCSWSATL